MIFISLFFHFSFPGLMLKCFSQLDEHPYSAEICEWTSLWAFYFEFPFIVWVSLDHSVTWNNFSLKHTICTFVYNATFQWQCYSFQLFDLVDVMMFCIWTETVLNNYSFLLNRLRAFHGKLVCIYSAHGRSVLSCLMVDTWSSEIFGTSYSSFNGELGTTGSLVWKALQFTGFCWTSSCREHFEVFLSEHWLHFTMPIYSGQCFDSLCIDVGQFKLAEASDRAQSFSAAPSWYP